MSVPKRQKQNKIKNEVDVHNVFDSETAEGFMFTLLASNVCSFFTTAESVAPNELCLATVKLQIHLLPLGNLLKNLLWSLCKHRG